MISIKSVKSYVPNGRVDVVARANQLDVSEEFLTKKLGVYQLSSLSEHEETSDIAVNAVQSLVEGSELELDDIECLVLCTQNPDDLGLPHTSSVVHQKLSLSDNVACFDISLGCSGYVYGLNVVQGMMLANGYHNAVLVTADPYSKIIDEKDKNTALLFGDAATATWLSNGAGWEIEKSMLYTRGSGGKHIKNINGSLHMDGRQVFNFAMTVVPEQINTVLSECAIDASQIDKWYLHQGSQFIVESLAKRLGVPLDKVPLGVHQCGNTVSSSIPLMIERDIETSIDKNIILSGFGVGLSWGTMLLRNTITI